MSRTSKVLTLAILMGVMFAGTSVATAAKVVQYRGIALRVPSAWPVFDLGSQPSVCVRFDRHAVYLGHPGASERCPAHLLGRTEAILVEPLTAGAAHAGSAAGAALSGAGAWTRILWAHARLAITATWHSRPAIVARALNVRALHPSRPTGRTAAFSARAASTSIAHSASFTTGLGFDPCATPSTSAMSAWKSSPYHSVGVYLGGTNMACAQPNLTSSWVRTETAAGWHFIPTYVGLQAPGSSCGGCAAISPSQAAAQGAAAATDAVSRAQAVSLGRGNPIYFDMEAYSTGGSATATVRKFLAAWTTTLHADGYLSGVYSSAASGISDLVAGQHTSFVEPDDVWIANWNNTRSTSDPYTPSAFWAAHQRIHQYSGGQDVTYGGVTINIDGDYVDGAVAPAGRSIPDSTFVQVFGSQAVYRIAGGAPLFVSSWDGFGGPQPITTITQSQFNSLSPVPADKTFLTTTTGRVFRMAGGAPLPVSDWARFGAVQPFVTIDQWNIDNIANPLSHLRSVPANGTLVQALPSRTYWQFASGGRIPVSANAAAIAVDELALAPFTILPGSSGGGSLGGSAPCVVPSLRHMTITQARRALNRAHCSLGKIRRPRHPRRHHVLRVASQAPIANASRQPGYAVGVTVT
jgi:hypothetical protein